MPKDTYTVHVPRVPGVTRARMAAYIKDAVSSWGGQFAPANPAPEDFCNEGDPLGPPCVLMKKGAVSVEAVSRHGAGMTYKP